MFIRMTVDEARSLQARNGAQPRQGRGHQKYNNQKVMDADGAKFDSKAEHRHWGHLQLRAKCGDITDLRRQVVYVLADGVVLDGRKSPALRYIADFVYVDASGRTVVEDVKGKATDVYRVKRHLMKAVHGIEVKEVRS